MSEVSVLDDIFDKGSEEVDEHAGEWFDKGLTEAMALTERLPGESSFTAKAALLMIRDRKAGLLHLGKLGLVSVLGHLGVDQRGEALRKFEASAKTATFSQLMERSAEAADAVIADKQLRAAAWAEVESLGAEAVRLAVPFLLACL